MATKAETDAAAAAQQQADDAELARMQAEEDAAKAGVDDADSDQAQSTGGVQKFRVLTSAAVLTAAGKNQGTRYTHGQIIELNADDENVQRLMALKGIELASAPYKGRATGRLIAEAANAAAQEDSPVFLADGQGTKAPDNGQATVILDPNHPEDADQ